LTACLAQQSENEKLESFFKSYLDERFRQEPMEASRLGDHRFDSRLEDVSPGARAGWLEHTRKTLKELPKRVEYSRLTRAGQGGFRDLQAQFGNTNLADGNRKPFEEDPRTYNDYISDSVYVLLTQSTLPPETNISNCIARMAEIPRVIATAKQTLTHPPKPILETAIRQNKGAISFYESELFQLAGESPQREKLKGAAAPIVAALQDYQKFLEGDLMSRASGDWRLGKRKFARKLELVLDAGMSADQVFADAQNEFDRVNREMYVIARQLWSKYFPKDVLPPDDAEGRRATILKVTSAVSQEHGKPEDLLKDARATVDRIKTFIREKDILRLPDPTVVRCWRCLNSNAATRLRIWKMRPPLDPNAPSLYACQSAAVVLGRRKSEKLS
jgi:hypothetical protein